MEIPGIQFLDCTVKMPLMDLPVRSVVVDLGSARVLISPGSELTPAQLAGAGAVTDIVAPSLLHCAGIPKAAAAFPAAKVWGIPGARKHRPEMPWTHELRPESWPFQEQLPVIPLLGMPHVRESVFVHRASGTLIVTDLCFHITRVRGAGAWVMTHLFGTYQRFAVSRLFSKFVKNRAEFQGSVEELFRHDFRRIVVSHGDVLEENARERLRLALLERGL